LHQKAESASKTGVLSLREHKLDTIPEKVYEINNMRTLDVSHNRLKRLPNQLALLKNLKSLNCESNLLIKGSLIPLTKLTNLTKLILSDNKLGLETNGEMRMVGPTLPNLPAALKEVKLDSNLLTCIPPAIYSPQLINLEKLDFSNNRIASIPEELCNHLKALTELKLDRNLIVSLPKDIGNLTKLKSLSLQHNQISAQGRSSFSEQNPQPLPAELFTGTPIIDLNLTGNRITNTQLNDFVGFDVFLERRQKLKSKNIYGGALTDLSVCGLK
jgi:Leucine-rich repeat (LRR) protein